MSLTLSRILFFSLVLLVLASLHYYVWARLVRDVALPRRARRWLAGLLITLGVLLPLSVAIQRALSPQWARPLLFPLLFWLGLLLLALVFLVGGDLIRLGARLGSRVVRRKPLDAGRRLALRRIVAGAAGAGALGTAARSVSAAIDEIELVRLEVKLRRLPAAMDGFRLAQITDLHIGPTLGRAWLQRVVDRVNALRPDLIAITGDLVDGTVERLRAEVSPLAQLRARHGVFFVTGNHEYYSGVEEWLVELRRMGVVVLENERVSIGQGAAASFDLAGVYDHGRSAVARGHRPDVAAACRGRDERRELILLAHQPRVADEAAQVGAGLTLCGHTHGGQIWPWHYAVYLQQPYLRGLNQHGPSQIYVSQGTGFWGPPMRLGSRGEITEITLRAAPDARPRAPGQRG